MKKVLSYVVLVLCYFASNCLCALFNQMLSAGKISAFISFVLTIFLSIVLAFLGFYLSKKITISDKGLRYKVLSIFTMFVGFVAGVSTLTSVNEDIELINVITNLRLSLMFLISLLNPAFIFGISLFVIYKLNYKNIITRI